MCSLGTDRACARIGHPNRRHDGGRTDACGSFLPLKAHSTHYPPEAASAFREPGKRRCTVQSRQEGSCFTKDWKSNIRRNTPRVFATALTSKCVIQKGGQGFDNVSLFRTFIEAAARLRDGWGRILLKWCCLQPFVAGPAFHLAVQCLSALPGPAGNPSSGLREGGAGVQPRLCLNAWNCKARGGGEGRGGDTWRSGWGWRAHKRLHLSV